MKFDEKTIYEKYPYLIEFWIKKAYPSAKDYIFFLSLTKKELELVNKMESLTLEMVCIKVFT